MSVFFCAQTSNLNTIFNSFRSPINSTKRAEIVNHLPQRTCTKSFTKDGFIEQPNPFLNHVSTHRIFTIN